MWKHLLLARQAMWKHLLLQRQMWKHLLLARQAMWKHLLLEKAGDVEAPIAGRAAHLVQPAEL